VKLHDVWNELRDARWVTDRSVTANGIRYRYNAKINRIEWDRPDDIAMAIALGSGKIFVDGEAVARQNNTHNLTDPRLRQSVEAALTAVHEAIHREKWEEEADVEREWKAALDKLDGP
jgi:mRNA-degrading endonuclease HigB of HigAB toxin-antitoxin module